MPSSNEELRARVFISCGQKKDSKEPTIATEIAKGLRDVGFDPYIAVEQQTLRDLKRNVFDEVANSEYFLFIDFKREALEGKACNRGSLFAHQELALASYLELDLLAFREDGVKKDDGILQFIQGNLFPFTERATLPNEVISHVQQRIAKGEWSPTWRNELKFNRTPGQFVDMPHQDASRWRYFHIDIRNLHRRRTAMNCFAYLESVKDSSGENIPMKTFELKWEAYTLPNAHILAGRERSFDAFCIKHDRPIEMRFLGTCDAFYVQPQILRPGKYELTYFVVADNFPPVRRSFTLQLGESVESTTLELA